MNVTWVSIRWLVATVAGMGTLSLQAAGDSLSVVEILEKASRAPQLSPGVEEVVKLSKAGVSDAVTLAYIQNSTTIYSLSAQNVLQLQEQGVSPQVVAAMLQHNGDVRRAAEANQAQAAAAAKSQPAPATTTPATTVVSAPAAAAPASTVSVTYFGSRPVSYYPSYSYYGPGFGYYYPAYPRYYGAYGYCGPRVAFGVGFGYPYRGYGRCW